MWPAGRTHLDGDVTHTKSAKPKLRAPKLSVEVRDHFSSRSRARGPNRRPWLTLIEVGLIVLVVSTAWRLLRYRCGGCQAGRVLAAIFVTPRVRQSSSSASDLNAVSDGIGIADLGPGLRVDRAEGAEQYRPVARSDADLTTTESAELSSDVILPELALPSHVGSYSGRKVPKPATQPVVDLSGCLDPGRRVSLFGIRRHHGANSARRKRPSPQDIRQRKYQQRYTSSRCTQRAASRYKSPSSCWRLLRAKWDRFFYLRIMPWSQSLKSTVSHPLPLA